MNGDIEVQTAAMSGPLGTVILLLVAGMLALGVELFIIPGFGIAGALGIGALIAGSIFAWLEFGAVWGLIAVSGTIFIATLMTLFFFRAKAVRKRLVLDTQLAPGCGTESEDLTPLLGQTGVAITALRPAGIARIGETRVDVVSEGGYIEKDTVIKVVAIDGPRVIAARAN